MSKKRKKRGPGNASRRRHEVKPDSVHEHALEEISENDRVWFEQHPGVDVRIRFGLPHEHCEPESWPKCVACFEVPPDAHARGARAITRVTQVNKGLRFRKFLIAFPGADGWNEHDGTLAMLEVDMDEAGLAETLSAYGTGDLTPRPGRPRTQNEQYELIAEEALNTGTTTTGTVDGQTVVGIPDVVMAEVVANEQPIPDSRTIARADGRTVTFFLAPEEET